MLHDHRHSIAVLFFFVLAFLAIGFWPLGERTPQERASEPFRRQHARLGDWHPDCSP